MCKTLISDYTFVPAVSGTVTFNGKSNITLDNLLLITNVTANEIIYNFADPAKGGTISTNVLTLEFDTSSMTGADALQIWYWKDDGKTLTREDSVDSTILYIGEADNGTPTSSARWKITRLTAAGKTVDVELANGNSKFSNVFDNRESLTYS